MSTMVLAIDTATPAVTAGVVRLDGLDGAGRTGHRRRPRARRAAHPECAWRAGRRRTDRQRSGRRGGRLRPGPVHRPAGRYGDGGGLRSRAGHPGARGVQSGRDRYGKHRHHVRSTRGHGRPSPRGVLGALPRRGPRRRPCCERAGRCAADAQAVAGSPEHAALFDLPAGAVYPTAAGLVRAVADWARRAGAVDSAVSASSRRQTVGGDADDGRLRLADPPRRRPVRGVGGPAVRRRRSVAGAGVPGRAGGEAHPLRRRPRRRQARRLRRHLPARPKTALTSTRFTPSGWTPRTRARASAGG